MKKLMIAAAVAVVGIAANAASISWASTDAVYCTKDSNGTVGATKATAASGLHNVALYIYELTSDPAAMEGGKTAAQKFAEAQLMDVATLYDTYYSTDSYSAKGATTGTGKVTATQTVDNESGVHYAVALFVDETNADLLPDGAERWVKAAVVASPSIDGSGTVTAPNLWSAANAKAANWTAVPVPEPTSGLLLLLGVAGMALRRRRA